MTAQLVAVGCVAVAVLLVLPTPTSRQSASTPRMPRIRRCLFAVLGLAAGPFVLGHTGGRSMVLVLAGAAMTAWAWRTWHRHLALTAAAGRRERVLSGCMGLAEDLRAGIPPGDALLRVADAWPEVAPAARTYRVGGDVGAAMRAESELPGAVGLRSVAAAWEVSHRVGSGLASALETVAGSLRDDDSTRRVVASELASARSTARLMAALPAIALLLGSGMGGDPLAFLLDTPAGWACLGVGLALQAAGLRWVEAIADGAEST